MRGSAATLVGMADDGGWLDCKCGQCVAIPLDSGLATNGGEGIGSVSDVDARPVVAMLGEERASTPTGACRGDIAMTSSGTEAGEELFVIWAVSSGRKRFSRLMPAPWLSVSIHVLILWLGGVAQQYASVLPQVVDGSDTLPSAPVSIFAAVPGARNSSEELTVSDFLGMDSIIPGNLSRTDCHYWVAIGWKDDDEENPLRSEVNVLPSVLLQEQGVFALEDPLTEGGKWLVDVSELWDTLERAKKRHSCKRALAVCEFVVVLLHFMKIRHDCPPYIRRISDMLWQLLVYGVSKDICACSPLEMVKRVLQHVGEEILKDCIHECTRCEIASVDPSSVRSKGDINLLSQEEREDCRAWILELAGSTKELKRQLRLWGIAESMSPTSTPERGRADEPTDSEGSRRPAHAQGTAMEFSGYNPPHHSHRPTEARGYDGGRSEDDECGEGSAGVPDQARVSPQRSQSPKKRHATTTVAEGQLGGGSTARVTSARSNEKHLVEKRPRYGVERRCRGSAEIWCPERELEIIEHLHSASPHGRHPSIVAAVGLSVLEGTERCLVMEYGGVELRTLLNLRVDWQLTFPRLDVIALGVARAMEFVSAQRVVHRDLAARNVLIYSSKGELHVRLADFGMAVLLPEGKEHVECNSRPPEWCCAPEVLRENKFSMKSDVYSFGVFLLELFADASDESELFFGVYEAWTGLIVDCKKEKPQERPTFSEIVKRIEDIVAAERQVEDL